MAEFTTAGFRWSGGLGRPGRAYALMRAPDQDDWLTSLPVGSGRNRTVRQDHHRRDRSVPPPCTRARRAVAMLYTLAGRTPQMSAATAGRRAAVEISDEVRSAPSTAREQPLVNRYFLSL